MPLSVAHLSPDVETQPLLSELAYAALRSDILEGEIAPGAKLKMDELQTRYQFSSSPLREALNRLSAESIVTADDRRGFRAAPATLADLHDLTAFRLVVEVNAFGVSITNGTAEWEAELIAAMHRVDLAQRRLPANLRSSDSEWIALHKAFHMALVGACGSTRLLAACSAMFDQSQRYRALSAKYRVVPRNSKGEHRRLVDAALRRDRDGGTQLLRDHIQRTADQVSQFLT